jgi:hypothetical protein
MNACLALGARWAWGRDVESSNRQRRLPAATTAAEPTSSARFTSEEQADTNADEGDSLLGEESVL